MSDPLRYAHVERERRWLLGSLPDGVTERRLVSDRYLDGTRLRLREVRRPDGTRERKLGHKVRLTDSPAAVACTSLYLDDAEWERLAALPGVAATKVRHVVERDGLRLAVDELADGTLLAEIDDADDRPARAPAWLDVIADVSTDEAWTGIAVARRAHAAGLDQAALSDLVMAAVGADPACADVLAALPALGLPDCWLTGGATFQNVWNAVTGREPGTGVGDLDVFYHDPADLSWEAEDAVIRAAAAAVPHLADRLQVRNQARVHLWYGPRFGEPAPPPLSASSQAIAGFAATTCALGVSVGPAPRRLLSPHGLTDVVAMRLRPHRATGLRAVYEQKASRYRRDWPELLVEPW